MNSGQGTRNLEQDFIGTQNKEIGIRYYRNNKQGTRNREQGTRIKKQETSDKILYEQGTRNKELGKRY